MYIKNQFLITAYCALTLLLLSNQTLAQTNKVTIRQKEFKIESTNIKKGRLAFTYNNSGQDDIYVLNFKTNKVSPLAVNPLLDESAPSWSSDGQHITYQASKKGQSKYDIYVSDNKAKNITAITKSSFSNEDPNWSPGGDEIAFSSKRGQGSSLFISNIDATYIKELAISKKAATELERPRFSPRKNSLLFTSTEYWPGKDIVLFNFKTTKIKILTTGYNNFEYPSWHPNGGSFIASQLNNGDVDIWQFKKGEASPKVLIERPGLDKDGIWADDGEKLFFSGEITPGKKDFQLFMWDNKEQKIYQISNSKGSISQPSWTPFPTLDEIALEIK